MGDYFSHLQNIKIKYKELQKKIDVDSVPKCSIFLWQIYTSVSKIAFKYTSGACYWTGVLVVTPAYESRAIGTTPASISHRTTVNCAVTNEAVSVIPGMTAG